MNKESGFIKEAYVKYRNKRIPKKDSHILKSKIPTSGNIAKLFSHLNNEIVEKTYIIHLDNKKEIRSYSLLSIGQFDNIIRKPADVFKAAILTNSTSIILVHNHPSGNPMPSKQNIIVTEILQCIGRLMDIKFVDHVIIGNNKYCSLKEKYIERWYK